MSTNTIDSIIEACKLKQQLWKRSALDEQKMEESKNSLFKQKNVFSAVQGTACPICSRSMTSDGEKQFTVSPYGHTVCSTCLQSIN
jgi:hypothetical protein